MMHNKLLAKRTKMHNYDFFFKILFDKMLFYGIICNEGLYYVSRPDSLLLNKRAVCFFCCGFRLAGYQKGFLMSKIIAVTSGKGGTGKSTVCAGLGYTLAKQGHRTLIIELDFGLRCLDIMFGMDGAIQSDLGDVLSGKKKVLDAVAQVPMASNLSILCAPKTLTAVTAEQIVDICRSIKKYFEYIIIDTGAGINSHVFDIVEQANLILVVTTPDPVCVRDASLMSDEFYNRGNKRQRLIINKTSKQVIGSQLVSHLDEIIDKIGVQLIGVVPDDFKITVATGRGTPMPSDSEALKAFDAISKRLGGEYIPLTVKVS